MEPTKGTGEELSTRAWSDRTRGNDLKLKVQFEIGY